VAGAAGSIHRIDLGTLADNGALASGLAFPRALAYAGGLLWTAVNGNGQWSQLAAVRPDGTVTVFAGTNYYNPDFATTPANPNALYLAQDGLSPGYVYRFDVTGGSPVLTASNTATGVSNIVQLTVSPDGTRVVPAAGSPYNFEEFDASTLEPDGVVYPAQPYPSAVAVSPGAGGLLATGLDHGYSTPDVAVFRLGVTKPVFTASTNLADGTANVVPHGLALSADGSRLFAVTADNVYANSFHLRVLGLSATSTTMTIAASPSPSGFGQPVTLTATVVPSDGGGTVAFTADNAPIPGCSAQPLVKGETGATAACTTTSLPLGQVTVTASSTGDAQYLASSGSATTTVNRGATATAATPAQLVKGKNGTYATTLHATLTAYGAALAGRTVAFASAGTQLCTARTDTSGNATCGIAVSNGLARSLVKSGYTAGFAGDAQYLPSSASAGVSG
jgi:Big-like domain-containing protein